MQYAVYNKNEDIIDLNQLDKELCEYLNIEEDPEKFSRLFQNFTFISSICIAKRYGEDTTSEEAINKWLKEKDNHWSETIKKQVAYLLRNKYTIKIWN